MTDKLAPFGFVQLAAWRPDSDEASFPVIKAFFSEHSKPPYTLTITVKTDRTLLIYLELPVL